VCVYAEQMSLFTVQVSTYFVGTILVVERAWILYTGELLLLEVFYF